MNYMRPRLVFPVFFWLLVCNDLTGASRENPLPSIQRESATRNQITVRNVLLICVDDLRPELGCYGVKYIRSPNIDRLAKRGRLFTRHYVQAPTCGASRYALLTGRYGPGNNGALFQRAQQMRKQPGKVPPSMPAWFRKRGYTTVSVGKVSHHPGGLGGKDWNDPAQPEMPDSWDRHLLPAGPWQHPRGWMHGLANGEIRVNARDMDVFQSIDGPDSIYPDGPSIKEALNQLDRLSRTDKPFFLAVGILRPHLPFGAPARYMKPYRGMDLPPIPNPDKPSGKTTWHGSGEFMKYNRWGRNPNNDPEFAELVRKHYAACVSYADTQVGKLLDRLKQNGKESETIVVLWGDHGWHLGEHAVWGKHTLFEESLRSPLIIDYPGIQKPGLSTNSIVETVDLFPTLCELTGIELPGFVDGESLVSCLKSPKNHDSTDQSAVSYFGNRQSIRTDRFRLIHHADGYHELYDHQTPQAETRNIAKQNPDVARDLSQLLKRKLNRE